MQSGPCVSPSSVQAFRVPDLIVLVLSRSLVFSRVDRVLASSPASPEENLSFAHLERRPTPILRAEDILANFDTRFHGLQEGEAREHRQGAARTVWVGGQVYAHGDQGLVMMRGVSPRTVDLFSVETAALWLLPLLLMLLVLLLL